MAGRIYLTNAGMMSQSSTPKPDFLCLLLQRRRTVTSIPKIGNKIPTASTAGRVGKNIGAKLTPYCGGLGIFGGPSVVYSSSAPVMYINMSQENVTTREGFLSHAVSADVSMKRVMNIISHFLSITTSAS